MYYICQYFSFILNAASDNFVVYHNLFSVYFVRNVQDAVSSFPQDKKTGEISSEKNPVSPLFRTNDLRRGPFRTIAGQHTCADRFCKKFKSKHFRKTEPSKR